MKHNNNMVARCCVAVGGFLAALTAGSMGSVAMAAEGVSSLSACTPPQLSQLFLPYNDANWYTLLPGETASGFNGVRWRFTGGARIVPAQLGDRRTGRVLDLPGGSRAVSPPVCVSSDFPTARAMARMMSTNQSVAMYVSIAGTDRYIGQVSAARGWAPSDSLPLQPAITGSLQRVQFTLVAGDGPGQAQLYDLALDPRMK